MLLNYWSYVYWSTKIASIGGHKNIFEKENKPDWFSLQVRKRDFEKFNHALILFFPIQVLTTRNITGNALVHWFCGGLSYQVEHHLFPQVPRHNLPLINVEVKALCKKHKIQYHETNMINGTIEVLNCLEEVANALITEFPAL